MAIKISGTTVIDNSKNINVGIVTVGSGSSAITLNTLITTLGVGVTVNIASGNVNASVGFLTVTGGFSFPLGLG